MIERPADRTPLGRAARHCISAADAVILARSFDSHSTLRRAQCLDDALDNLRLAIQLIEDEQPEPPATALTAEQIRRADLVATMMDIAATPGLDPAFAGVLREDAA